MDELETRLDAIETALGALLAIDAFEANVDEETLTMAYYPANMHRIKAKTIESLTILRAQYKPSSDETL